MNFLLFYGGIRLEQTGFFFLLVISFLMIEWILEFTHSCTMEAFEQINFRLNFKFQLETYFGFKVLSFIHKAAFKNQGSYLKCPKGSFNITFSFGFLLPLCCNVTLYSDF